MGLKDLTALGKLAFLGQPKGEIGATERPKAVV